MTTHERHYKNRHTKRRKSPQIHEKIVQFKNMRDEIIVNPPSPIIHSRNAKRYSLLKMLEWAYLIMKRTFYKSHLCSFATKILYFMCSGKHHIRLQKWTILDGGGYRPVQTTACCSQCIVRFYTDEVFLKWTNHLPLSMAHIIILPDAS